MGLRILVAEDNAINQELLLMVLESSGFTADVAKNGLEVLAALKTQDYDVILMDLSMPKMDGTTAAREIRRTMGDKAPRIIALTASTERDSVPTDCFTDFLSKPISRDTLLRVLAGLAAPLPVERAGNAPLPTLNFQVFRDCAGDDKESQSEFVGAYQGELSRDLPRLEDAVRRGDAAQVKTIAHGLRGASAVMGGMRLSQLLGQLEDCPESDLIGAISDEVSELRQALSSLG